MSTNLDTYFNETTERYYNRLINIYKKRMAVANDKEYTHNEFWKFCLAVLEIRYGTSERYQVVLALEHEYKVGKELTLAIKTLRKKFRNPTIKDNSGIIGQISEKGILLQEEEYSIEKEEPLNIDQYSDLEMVRMFSEFKANEKFKEFMETEKHPKQIEKSLDITVPEIDYPENNKEFTTTDKF